MSKDSKREKREPATGLARLFAGRSWTVFTLLLLVAVGLVGRLAHQKYYKRISSDSRFDPVFQVTIAPEWISTDTDQIVDEVKRDGSLHEISLLDVQATRRIAEAFELHPWVKQVDHVSKHASGTVKVKLLYRRPVGMVKVKGRYFLGSAGMEKVEGGHFPVDEDGNVLPVDVDADVVGLYPRIEVGDDLWPAGIIGEPWGDSRVMGAAKIAAVFGSAWQELKLFAIVFNGTQATEPENSTGAFVLRTLQRHRIMWGNAPGEEARSEASAADKIRRLVDYVHSQGPLESLDPNIEIDLTHSATIKVTRRLAKKSFPESTN